MLVTPNQLQSTARIHGLLGIAAFASATAPP